MKTMPFLIAVVLFAMLAQSCELPDSAPTSYTISFDADGGIVSPAHITVSAGGTPGGLPVPVGGDGFCGWFTEKRGGGLELTETTVVDYSCTVYAKWTQDIYIIGIRGGGNPSNAAACLRNGTPFFHWVGDRINDITVVGSDIYLAGSGRSIGACYWKNGKPTDLGDGYVYAIAVSGDAVYTAGSYYNRDDNKPDDSPGAYPCYWKNGMRVDLANEAGWGKAVDIAVSGENVYVSGYYINDNTVHLCYWENGIPTDLISISASNWNGIWLGSIAISGGDVYCLTQSIGSDGYWKNGIFIPLASNAHTHDIFVLERDVYVTGYYGKDNKKIACYWKNGEKIDLFEGSPVSSFVSSGGDVFTTGARYTADNNIFAYWKNSDLITDSDQISSYVYRDFDWNKYYTYSSSGVLGFSAGPDFSFSPIRIVAAEP